MAVSKAETASLWLTRSQAEDSGSDSLSELSATMLLSGSHK